MGMPGHVKSEWQSEGGAGNVIDEVHARHAPCDGSRARQARVPAGSHSHFKKPPRSSFRSERSVKMRGLKSAGAHSSATAYCPANTKAVGMKAVWGWMSGVPMSSKASSRPGYRHEVAKPA